MIVEKLKLLQDIFLDSEFVIGGSFARSMILSEGSTGSTGTVTRDIDIYTNTNICRYAFVMVLKEVVFKGMNVTFTTETSNTPGNPDMYKMPNIKRRITAHFPDSMSLDYDFIMLDKEGIKGSVSEWLLRNQASTLSECSISLKKLPEFVPIESPWDFKYSDSFHKSLMCSPDPVFLNIHSDSCTPEHVKKVRAFCKSRGLTIKEYSASN